MQRNETRVCEFGWRAPEFDLPGVDGRRYTLASTRGPKGALVMFICNHCPYVKAVLERIVRDCAELAPQGIGAVVPATAGMPPSAQLPLSERPKLQCRCCGAAMVIVRRRIAPLASTAGTAEPPGAAREATMH